MLGVGQCYCHGDFKRKNNFIFGIEYEIFKHGKDLGFGQ